MTAVSASQSTAVFSRLVRHAPSETTGAVLLAALGVVFLLAIALDTRLIAGVNPWVKPLKFSLSLSLYLGTLAWFAHLLPEPLRQSRAFRIYMAVVLFCIAIEVLWIASAAFLGTTSHFNTASLFWGVVYGIMGFAAVTLTSAALVWGIAIWRRQPGGLARLIAASLMLTFLLTVPIAGYMSSQPGHFVGDAASDAGGLWLVGWSRTVGDLRVAHFFATHAMQILPMTFVCLLWLRGPKLPRGTGALLCALFAGFTIAVFLQALAGRPFLT